MGLFRVRRDKCVALLLTFVFVVLCGYPQSWYEAAVYDADGRLLGAGSALERQLAQDAACLDACRGTGTCREECDSAACKERCPAAVMLDPECVPECVRSRVQQGLLGISPCEEECVDRREACVDDCRAGVVPGRMEVEDASWPGLLGLLLGW
jgi:hypothetical protein